MKSADFPIEQFPVRGIELDGWLYHFPFAGCCSLRALRWFCLPIVRYLLSEFFVL